MARGFPVEMAMRTGGHGPSPGCLILYASRPASRALRVGSADGLRPPLTPAGSRSLGTGREMAAVCERQGVPFAATSPSRTASAASACGISRAIDP